MVTQLECLYMQGKKVPISKIWRYQVKYSDCHAPGCHMLRALHILRAAGTKTSTFLSSNIVEIFMHDYLDIIILIKYVKLNFKNIIYFERY